MYKDYIKRLLDIIAIIMAFPLFIVLVIIFAPLIKFEDNGPVFYRATRVGKDGVNFRIFKFRSMKVNAPDLRMSDGSTFNGENDHRVTRIGKLLRKTSIDEVPQILNVLKGEMSIIGPRPSIPNKRNDNLDSFVLERRKVRPGITGYTQAYFRNSITQDEKLKYDAYYVKRLSFILDCKILFRTVKTVVKRDNLYVRNTNN